MVCVVDLNLAFFNLSAFSKLILVLVFELRFY